MMKGEGRRILPQSVNRPCPQLNYTQSKTRGVELSKGYRLNVTDKRLLSSFGSELVGHFKRKWKLRSINNGEDYHCSSCSKNRKHYCHHDVSRSLFRVSSYPLVQGTQGLCFKCTNKTNIPKNLGLALSLFTFFISEKMTTLDFLLPELISSFFLSTSRVLLL